MPIIFTNELSIYNSPHDVLGRLQRLALHFPQRLQVAYHWFRDDIMSTGTFNWYITQPVFFSLHHPVEAYLKNLRDIAQLIHELEAQLLQLEVAKQAEIQRQAKQAAAAQLAAQKAQQEAERIKRVKAEQLHGIQQSFDHARNTLGDNLGFQIEFLKSIGESAQSMGIGLTPQQRQYQADLNTKYQAQQMAVAQAAKLAEQRAQQAQLAAQKAEAQRQALLRLQEANTQRFEALKGKEADGNQLLNAAEDTERQALYQAAQLAKAVLIKQEADALHATTVAENMFDMIDRVAKIAIPDNRFFASVQNETHKTTRVLMTNIGGSI